MEIKIISQETNKLLSRDEYRAEIKEHKTPSYVQVKEEISKKTGKPADLIVVKNVNQQYGKSGVDIKFYVYSNQEALKKLEKEKKAAPKAQ